MMRERMEALLTAREEAKRCKRWAEMDDLSALIEELRRSIAYMANMKS